MKIRKGSFRNNQKQELCRRGAAELSSVRSPRGDVPTR